MVYDGSCRHCMVSQRLEGASGQVEVKPAYSWVRHTNDNMISRWMNIETLHHPRSTDLKFLRQSLWCKVVYSYMFVGRNKQKWLRWVKCWCTNNAAVLLEWTLWCVGGDVMNDDTAGLTAWRNRDQIIPTWMPAKARYVVLHKKKWWWMSPMFILYSRGE